MNNVNMNGMNPMGGPVGGGMPMMNNGAGARPTMPVSAGGADQRAQLNTYIYEYFLKNEMFDCARSLLNSEQPLNTHHKNSPGQNGEGADGDAKDEADSKRPDDLPAPNLPKDCQESCFLYEWWCLFWDMFNAQRGKGDGRAVMQYVNHTQAQSRQRQEQQAAVLRNIRADMMPQGAYQQMMMRGQANGMTIHQNELRKNAIQNRQQNATPQQAQQQMLAQQKANQMQRDPSESGNPRPQSPGSAENAPSPSKRPRLEGAGFNPQQIPNGRGQAQGMPQQVGDSGPSNAIQAAHMQLTNGLEPNNLTSQQFQVQGGANAAQARSLAGYQAGLAQQQATQMPVKAMPNQGGPPNQGSPMMAQGPNDGNIANYYNPTDMGANGMRGPAGAPGAGSGNHALQDYQMQLMLLEQQNKKRLMMARQEQDSMALPRADGSGAPGAQAMGPNGTPFQGASPGARNSPNPADQIKRTPHMNPANNPSPIPDGQNRGSPSGMNFGNMPGNPMDPNMNPKFYQMNGMDPNMVGAGMQNGMRPPSSHPGAGFNPNMAQQQQQLQMQQAQQQRAAQQQQQANGQNWTGPNGPMVAQPGQGAPQQNMGTPRQGQMPPPSAPATGAAANGRTQPSSPQQGTAAPPTPQQGTKANPKKKPESKDAKAKRAAKKGSAANLNAGATPSADVPTDGPTPTPQTPITPVHKNFNGQNGAAQPVTNGQPPAPTANAVAQQQPDQGFGILGVDNYNSYDQMPFTGAAEAGMDVLQDFDFDSFLHQDGDGVDNFSFDTFPMDDQGIGAD